MMSKKHKTIEEEMKYKLNLQLNTKPTNPSHEFYMFIFSHKHDLFQERDIDVSIFATVRFVSGFHGSSPPVKLPVEPQPEKTNTGAPNPPSVTRNHAPPQPPKVY